MWYWPADNLFWQLSIDHNMDMQYQVQALRLAEKCDILLGSPVVPMYGQVATEISWVDKLLYKWTSFNPPTVKKLVYLTQKCIHDRQPSG